MYDFFHYILDMDDMVYDINTDPIYPLGASFFGGILFSSLSWGIIFYFLFLLIYFIAYYQYTQYNNLPWHLDQQIGIFAASLFGFLIGREIIGKGDHKKSIEETKYGIRYWLQELDLVEDCSEVHDYWQRWEDKKCLEEENRRQRFRDKGFYFEPYLSESHSYSSNSNHNKGVTSDSIDSLSIYGQNRLI